MIKTNLPVLIIKNLILFPSSEIRLEFEREEEKELLSLAENYYNNQILLVNPTDEIDNKIHTDELPNVGVVGLIKMKMEMPNKKMRVIIKGEHRVKIYAYSKDEELFEAMTSLVPSSDNKEEKDPKEELAYKRKLMQKLEEYTNKMPSVGNAVLSQVDQIHTLDKLTDVICLHIENSYERKLEYIKEIHPVVRAKMLLDDMERDLSVLELEKDIDTKVNKKLEHDQKEFILREKLKVIKEELGEEEDFEVKEIKEAIKTDRFPKNVKERLEKELIKMNGSFTSMPDGAITRNYIDWLLSLPFGEYTKDNKDLNKIEISLNKSHFGLLNIKERIIEYIAVKQSTDHAKSPIICLVGPPGVGKTSLAISIAKALNRNYTKISVGGINDEAELVGHRKTYVGAMPGKIIQGIKKSGSMNPVFIIDEIDKMTKDIKGDPASALLEILDPNQNDHFQDHYIEEEISLKDVFFILTANYVEQIPLELQDRLEIIELSSYTELEKLDILKQYIIKEQLINHGLTMRDVKFDDGVLEKIIRSYTCEAGVRDLSRRIETIFRKIVKNRILKRRSGKKIITLENLDEYLGVEKYSEEVKENKYTGYIHALAYTPVGGKVLGIEIVKYKGTGKIEITGSIGKVMEESVEIAFSYVFSHCKDFKIEENVFLENDFHVHFVEGAIKKDGPSAGVSVVCALISLLKNKKIASTLSMSGEMTLRGEVLPVGGIKEKLIAAYTNNINKVFLPKENEKDLIEVPNEVKEQIEFIFVQNYKEIYKKLF